MLSKEQRTNRIYFPERVIRDMEKIADYPLTVVEAPMGYGKSTAVKASLKDLGFSHIWIDVNDDSVGTIWNEMCVAIEPFYEGISRQLLAYGPPKDRDERLNILNIIKNISIQEKLIIVLDDFHLVRDEAIYKFI